MAIFPDRRIVETVGGGGGEAEVVRTAIESLASRSSATVQLDMSGSAPEGPPLVCGGRMEVLVEPLTPDKDAEWVRALVGLREKGPGVLLLRSLHPGPRPASRVLLVAEDSASGASVWRSGEAAIPSLDRFRDDDTGAPPAGGGGKDGPPSRRRAGEVQPARARGSENRPACLFYHPRPDPGTAGAFYLLESIPPVDRLVIVGGGHIGRALCEIGSLLRFEVTVVDEREEFARPERFPHAVRVCNGDPEEVLGPLPGGEHAHFVLVSHGYASDVRALRALSGKEARYIGMIGSRRRVEIVRRALRQDGIEEDHLDRLFAPVGIDIHAETPEEIAVSIAAEIIAVRGGLGHRAGSLSRIGDEE
jgi:xanthine dehydrogenase accessory factor